MSGYIREGMKKGKRRRYGGNSMDNGKAVYIGATLVSILISIALYQSGRRELAIFVGLWAPTILNLGQSLVDEDE